MIHINQCVLKLSNIRNLDKKSSTRNKISRSRGGNIADWSINHNGVSSSKTLRDIPQCFSWSWGINYGRYHSK